MDNRFTLNLSSFPEELKVMLAMMRTGEGEGRTPVADWPPKDIDWDHWLKLVRHHRVYPQVYANHRGSEWIPADVRRALHQDYGRNAFQMLRLGGEMERVCRSFREKGVPSLVLKGPVLAKELYGDLSLRTSKDLDILIPVADVERAERILDKLGYVCDKNVPRVLGEWKWKVHHASYTNPQTRIQLEIHWRLNSEMGKEPSFAELWKRKRSSSVTRDPVYMPGSEDLFMYLVSHGARHGWFRLRWLADIDRMVRQRPDCRTLIPLLRRHDCLDLAGQALVLASSLLHTPVPEDMEPLLSRGRGRTLAQRSIPFIQDIVSFSPEPSKELNNIYKRYLFSLKSARQKGKFAISRLYPSFRDAQALPLPKPLHFLYFPLRPFVWLWRQMKQQA